MLNDFLVKNWFDLLQSAFIVGGFVLSYRAIHSDIQSRKVEHLLQINQSHREIWAKTYTQPELLRIKETDVDLEQHPITDAERRMVQEVIMHIFAVYEAIQNNQLDKGEMEKDIADYLNLPIPYAVWQDVKRYYKKQFIQFIDRLSSKES